MRIAQKFKNYRTLLDTMRARAVEHAAQIREEPSDSIYGEPGDGFSNAPVDPADRAGQQREAAVTIGIAENAARLRVEIDAALERIDAGTFGICEECGAVIAARRLSAVPYARCCIRCERLVEQLA